MPVRHIPAADGQLTVGVLDDGELTVRGGEAVLTPAGERVRYRAGDDGAEYVAICLPAFAPELAGREDDA